MYRLLGSVVLVLCFLFAGTALASDQERDRDRDRDQLYDQSYDRDRDRDRSRDGEYLDDDEVIYGWQLMTERERYQYREQLRSMQTPEQREQFRRQHHEQMQQRAKKQGKKLPDFPPEPLHKGYRGSDSDSGPGSGGGGKYGRK